MTVLVVLLAVEIVALAFVLAWQSKLVAEIARQQSVLAQRMLEHETRLDVLEAFADAQIDERRLGDVWGDE